MEKTKVREIVIDGYSTNVHCLCNNLFLREDVFKGIFLIFFLIFFICEEFGKKSLALI